MLMLFRRYYAADAITRRRAFAAADALMPLLMLMLPLIRGH